MSIWHPPWNVAGTIAVACLATGTRREKQKEIDGLTNCRRLGALKYERGTADRGEKKAGAEEIPGTHEVETS
jgi:hypothetical protein